MGTIQLCNHHHYIPLKNKFYLFEHLRFREKLYDSTESPLKRYTQLPLVLASHISMVRLLPLVNQY